MKKLFIGFIGVLLATTASFAQNPSIGGYHVYYGHIHNHCGYSDPDQAYSYAKTNSDLDFFGLSDHAEMLTSSEYEDIISKANYYNEDGVFTTFYGFEWTSAVRGHVSVFNTSEYETSGWWIFGTFNSLLDWVNSRDCIAFFNHPGSYNGLNLEFDHFSDTPSDKFVGMELWNSNNTFDVYYYNDGYFGNDGNKGYFDEALTRGWRIGAAGSEDNHDNNWGNKNDYRMAVLSNNLTRTDLTNALKARRFYSTLDKNISMSFKINGNEMGSFINSGNLNVQIQLKDGNDEYFNKVELLKNGAVVHIWNINEQQPELTFTTSGADSDYFYIKCKQADGNEAISSPIFVSEASSVSIPFARVNESELKNTGISSNYEEKEAILPEDLSFVIYPNPATGKSVNVRVDELTNNLQLIVTDINGRILVNEHVHENIFLLPELNSGVYFVRMTNRVTTKTQTLLIK